MIRVVRTARHLDALIDTFIAGSGACVAERTGKFTSARMAVVSRSTLDLPFGWCDSEDLSVTKRSRPKLFVSASV